MSNEQYYFGTDDTQTDNMIDISSSSKPKRTNMPKSAVNPVSAYSNGIFKNLGNIIKFIAFMIAFFIIAVSFVGAYFLFSIDKFFMAISLAIVIFGVILAMITLFLIYGLGQVICQNNEILKRLDD